MTFTRKTAVLVFLLLLSIVFSAPLKIPNGHGATIPTGEVCLADPTSASASAPCPATGPTFAGPKGEQIRIGVFIQNSYNVTGFFVILLADHHFLVPTRIDLAGTVLLGTPQIATECFQGVLKIGNKCGYTNTTATTDTVDTLDLSVNGGLGQHTTSPTTGLLFTAIYNITGVTASGGISMGYQNGNVITPPGCTGSSVSGNVCVTIAGGTANADPETVQGATFDNSGAAGMQFVSLSASQTLFGPQFPGVTNNVNVVATAVNGYGTGFISYTDLVTLSPTATPGLTVTGVPSSCATGGTSCTTPVSLSAAASGNYSVTIFGVYATQDALGNLDTLVANATVNVLVYDFGFAVQSPVTFISGSTGVGTITLSSLNHFIGTITLSTGTIIPLAPPLKITFGPNPVTLSAGQTLTSTATFSASPTASTVYHAQIKATSGTQSKTTTPPITVNVNIGHLTSTSLSCLPNSIKVFDTTTCTATVSDLNTSPTSPSGTVSFATNSTGTFNPANGCSLSAGTAGIATCQVTYSPTVLGNGIHNVTATYNGDTTHGRSSGSFLLTVAPATLGPDFNVTASSLTIGPLNVNVQGKSTITVNYLRGFTGTVNLSTNASPGLLATVDPGSVTGTGTATLTVSSGSAGTYTVTVTASNSTTFSHTTKVIQVTVVDFGLSANPSTLNLGQGTFAKSNITLTILNGYAGTVSLTAVASTGLSFTIIPASISGSALAVLNVTAPSSIALGTYNVNVTGTDGPLSHKLEVVVNVLPKDFAITANPTAIATTVVAFANSTITVTPIVGFTGTIALTSSSSPAGPSCNLSPTSVILGTAQSAKLSCSSATVGSFKITVFGTNGTRTKNVNVTISFADFTVAANPTSLTPPAGTNADSTITVAPVSSSTGTVLLTFSVKPSGLTCTLTPGSITLGSSQTSKLSCSSTSAATFTVTVNGTMSGLVHSATVSYQVTDFTVSGPTATVVTTIGTQGTATITVAPVNGFTGTVLLASSVDIPGLVCTLTPSSVVLGISQTSTLSCSSSSATTYHVTVTGTLSGGSLSHPASATYQITSFDIAVSDYAPRLPQGNQTLLVVTVVPDNGFTGTVTLGIKMLTNVPKSLWPNATLAQTSITVTAGMQPTTSLNLTVALWVIPGLYGVNITGTSPTLATWKLVQLTVPRPDFGMSASPQATIVRLPGVSGIANITVTSIDGYVGAVNLSVAIIPSSGLTCTLSQPSVLLRWYASNFTLLSCHGTTNPYAVAVTGTPANQYAFGTHTANVGYAIVDFALSSTPTGILVNTSQQGNARINVTWTSGYSGTVSLTAVPNDNALKATITPTSLSATGTATLTISSDTAGVYTVVVNATSGSVSHTVKVTVTVLAVSPAANILGLDPTLFYSIVGVLTVAVIGGIVAVLRRGKGPTK